MAGILRDGHPGRALLEHAIRLPGMQAIVMDNLLVSSIRFHASVAAFLTVGAFVGLSVASAFVGGISLMLTLFLMGACGGVVATFQRLKRLPVAVTSFDNPVSNKLAIFQTYTSPMVAGIFAIVLMAFFQSGALEGFVVPRFTSTEDVFVSLDDFLKQVAPASNQDVALCAVWSFAAGYSEKLVPTILDRLVQELSASDATEDTDD